MNLRNTAVLAAAALVVLPAAPAAATVRESTLTYQCTYPRIGTHTLTAKVKIDLPDTWGAGTPTPDIELSADLSLGTAQLQKIATGLGSVNGSAIFSGSFRTADGTSTPFKTSSRIPNRPIEPPIPDPWELPALSSDLPAITLDEAGPAGVHLDKLALNLRPLDANGNWITLPRPDIDGGPAVPDSDGDPNTFDVPCTLSPTEQSTKLATIDILGIDGSLAGSVPAQCRFSFIGTMDGSVAFSSGAVQARVGEPFALDARMNATFPDMPGAFDGPDRVDGTLNAALSLVPVSGGPAIPVTGSLSIGKSGYISGSDRDLVLDSFGALSGGPLPAAGDYELRLDAIRPNLTIYGDGWGDEGPIQAPPVRDFDGNPVPDSDGDPYTTDMPCKVGTGGASTVLGTVSVADAPTPTPPVGDPTPTPVITPTPTPPVGDPTPTPTPTPVITPTPTVPTPIITTPDPSTCSGSTAKYSYALSGSTTINTLTKGTMPLTGAIDAVLCLSNGSYTAQTVLNDTQGRLIALGFLPVTVSVGIVPSGATTGQLVDDQLTANLKARIKVKSVKAFGAIPLAGGNSCQSKQLSDIKLKSTDSFDPTGTGGTIGGTYAISDLNGCGILNGLVSPLTAGGGNTITAKLTPKS